MCEKGIFGDIHGHGFTIALHFIYYSAPNKQTLKAFGTVEQSMLPTNLLRDGLGIVAPFGASLMKWKRIL